MKVFKFGGASVKNAEAIQNVARIVTTHNSEPLMIVVSAIGKTTNALEEVVSGGTANENTAAKIKEIISAHA
ncbi:MAG TPA: aspartate kinase, partial [Cyclobacteriaceae bacterium]|nr:aspartate kinase [Cyclobacteriaceae bacterium]